MNCVSEPGAETGTSIERGGDGMTERGPKDTEKQRRKDKVKRKMSQGPRVLGPVS
jgi:hypothetical protein